jgi:hypothetical protein
VSEAAVRILRAVRTLTCASLAATVALAPLPTSAQGPLVSATATLSADTVELGAAFELRVSFDVRQGTRVHFPDTLAATESIESLAPVTWSAEPAADGGARLTLTYPLIAFRAGNVPVPGLDVVSAPAGSLDGLERLPGGSGVGAWSDAPLGAGGVPLRFPRRPVWVTPALTPDRLQAGVEPMPAGDVVGPSWHWPSVGLALLSSMALLGVVVSAARTRVAARLPSSGSRGDTLEDARLAALAELDRLIATVPRDGPRMRDLYTRSSGAVRGYVERLDPAWGPNLTSSELMAELYHRARGGSARALVAEMEAAETVKFGRRRPEPPTAEEHLRALRHWVAESGGSDRDAPAAGP